MDSNLTRLCAISGNHDLSQSEVADVLQNEVSYVRRVIQRGLMEAQRLQGRRSAHRVRIPRASVVRYLFRISTGDRSVILASIKTLCPQYLPAVQDLIKGEEPKGEEAVTPDNVIPMHGPRTKRPAKDPYEGHPMLFSA